MYAFVDGHRCPLPAFGLGVDAGRRVRRIALGKAARVIRSRGAQVLYLPPYSPDLNPIENVFAKVKQCLRSLACRSREALWQTMQSVLDQITPSDAANCFRHCGYTLQVR